MSGLGAVLVRLRRRWLTAPLAAWVRRAQPAMSETERAALRAGGVWWDRELFSGRPDWSVLLDLPVPRLSPEERAFLDGPVERLCGMLDDWRITHELRDLPPEVWERLKRERFLGLTIPKAWGGHGFSAQAHSAIVQRISTRSLAAAVTVMVPNSLGPAELLERYGTPAQKRHYLPRLARGEEIPCFALTGPEAGSDAAAIPDRGVVCRQVVDGREVLGMRVTWSKRYITLAPVATLMGLAFRLSDPDGLLGDRPEPGITLALVPTDTPGVEIGRRHWPAGQAFHNGPTSGRDVFLPLDAIVGGPEMAGQGWRMLMECLSVGRGISLPAVAAGGAQTCARITGAYARVRRQFGRPIGRFEGVGEALARIAGNAYALEAARRVTVAALDAGERPAVLCGVVKYQSTARLREAVTDAMDVHGGKAICDGPSNTLANVYAALPIAITVEGANILTRSLIVFGQGALRGHPHLLAEIEAAQAAARDPARLADFERALVGHLAHLAGTLVRATLHTLTGGRLARVPDAGPATRHYRAIARLSAAFALLTEALLLTLGGGLKRREMLSGRMADVLGELYLASCALKRFEDDGRPEADRPLLDWTCARACAAADARIDEVLANLPVRPVAWVLRALVRPFGRAHAPPPDALTRRCAELIQTPSPTRERLTGAVHLGDRDGNLGVLERALAATLDAERVEARLAPVVGRAALTTRDWAVLETAVARGIAGRSDLRRLAAADALRARAIAVDDFASEDMSRRDLAWQDSPRMAAPSMS